jgi:hypothetical protein
MTWLAIANLVQLPFSIVGVAFLVAYWLMTR